jgi:hypothetical protein
MSRRIIAGLAAAGVAILASCSQDRSPNAFLPTEASLAKAPPPGPICSFTAANTYAKNYFVRVTGNTKDPVFAALDAMQKVATPGGNALETSAGFNVLTRVAAAAGTADVKVGAEAQGSAFVNEVALCQNLNGFVYLSSQFTKSLSYGGLFAVRANGNTDFIIARTGRYGAQPTTSAGWPISSGQALFYGAPLADQSTLSSEILVGGTAFDLKTLPTPLTFVPQIRVGICDMDVLSSDNPRLLHVHAGTPAAVLAQSAPTFCPTTFTSIEAPRSIFTVAAHQVASWLSPKPAYAANMMFLLKIGGGTVGGLSEIGSVAPQDTIILDRVPNAAVSDTTLGQDADTTTSQFKPNPVRVRVLTKASKAPIGGVTINLTVIGNKGSYAAFGGSAVTDADGYARFPNFYINKAGGYTISAQAPDTEFGPGSFTALSNLFNISGQ